MHFFRTYANTARVRKYFVDLCAAAIKHREQNHIVRKDFMQLLLQLRNSDTGAVGADGDWHIRQTQSGAPKSLTLNDCAAQTFLFYTAGFDTSSSALTYALYELCRNPECMRKLQCEIDEVLDGRHGGEITYDALAEMKYLELCILGKCAREGLGKLCRRRRASARNLHRFNCKRRVAVDPVALG